ncbi:MAG: ABC transporter ATP-binding protein/permease [Planctomycetaceae bacterium]|jgi:ABC-type multidrug transport system fused ATPase/permease subunit|nr:ABC transporter ATP-binding protein/permease [Planctomycetaceae bacterium]
MWQKIKSFFFNNNPDAQVKWSMYGRVWWEFGLPYWKWITAGVLCTICAAAAEAYSITLVKKIVEGGIIEQQMDVMTFVGLQLIAAFTLKGVFSYAKVLLMTKAGLLGVTALRRRIYRHMVNQPMAYFHGQQTGPLMTQITVMADGALSLVTDTVITTVQSVASMAFMLGLMLWYAPYMTVVLLVLAPGILIPFVIIMRRQRVLVRTTFGVHGIAISHVTQSILGIKTIQSFGTEGAEAKKMNTIEDQRIKAQFRLTRLIALQTPLLEIVISIGIFLALVAGGWLIIHGKDYSMEMTAGDFLVFLLALTAIYKPAKVVTTTGGSVQKGLIAAENVFKFLEQKPTIMDAPDAIELEHAPMVVAFDNVTFAYNNVDGDVLHAVSLAVQPGTICAFVGPSGGGKSTMFNLIGRFYDPQYGNIFINGEDIRSYTLASLRGNIAVVSQDVFLFAGTIADNIRYGSPDATQEQIQEAARAANAHEFIINFPKQYENEVGERGTLLSGGQKQRIAIARAILKDAPILLLDEATSALDSRSEQQIQEALKTLMRGRTTFVIAHRLATILDADIIYVIKDGRIVEKGTDAELYQRGGEYRKLKDIQFP